MLFLTCSSSFAQKEDLKALEKAIKRNNIEEATMLITKIAPLIEKADEVEKASFLYHKALNELNLSKNNIEPTKNKENAIESINKLLALETETKSKKYTTEILPVKNELLANIVNEAIQNNKANKLQQSSRLFNQAYQLSKTDTVYLFYAASDAVNAKDFDFAESKYKELVKLKYEGKMNTYVATSQISGNIESFGIDKKARDLAVKHGSHTKPETVVTNSVKPEIYNNLSQILINKENYSEGEQYALKAYEIDSNNVNSLMNVLYLYYNTNRLYKYLEYAKKGLDKFPKNETLLYNLGVIEFGNGNNDGATTYFNQILEINPKNFEALKGLGNIALQKDADITTKINNLPNTNSANKQRTALMNDKKKTYQEALNFYSKAKEVNSKDDGLNDLIYQIEDFLNKN